MRHCCLTHRNRRRGTTVLELLIYSTILGLVMTGIYSVLIAGMRYFHTADTSVELQSNAMDALANISQQLAEGNGASCSIGTSPAGIVFGSPRDANGNFQFNSSGSLLWQKYVCFYIDTVTLSGTSVSCLIRKEEMLPAAQTTPPVIPSSKTTSYFRSANLPLLKLNLNITGLTISGANPLQITVTANKSDSAQTTNQVQVQTKILLRN